MTAELYQVLPRWLFEMVLLLQNNNVQMAITKSAQHAPAVLGSELAGALRENGRASGSITDIHGLLQKVWSPRDVKLYENAACFF